MLSTCHDTPYHGSMEMVQMEWDPGGDTFPATPCRAEPDTYKDPTKINHEL